MQWCYGVAKTEVKIHSKVLYLLHWRVPMHSRGQSCPLCTKPKTSQLFFVVFQADTDHPDNLQTLAAKNQLLIPIKFTDFQSLHLN